MPVLAGLFACRSTLDSRPAIGRLAMEEDMAATAKPLLGNRYAANEQGSCGTRRKLLEGGTDRQFAVSQVVIEDARPHYHNDTWELYVVQSGRGVLKLGDKTLEVEAGDVIEIPPGTIHQAIPDPAMTVLVIMSPQSAEAHDLHYV